MSDFCRIAVAGASGNFGISVVNALVAAGFKVTVLTRMGYKSASPPAALYTIPVDYSSKYSLAMALKDHEGLVSLFCGDDLLHQPTLIDAAIEAGVSRFIPSEFGCDTRSPGMEKLPIFADKVNTFNYLTQKIAEVPSLSYTAIISGPFTDFCLMVGLIIYPKERSALLVDGGEHYFSTTPIVQVAKAIANVFINHEATKNQVIYVQSYRITQNQALKLGEKVTGTKWSTTEISSKNDEASAWEELKKPDSDGIKAAFSFLRTAIFTGRFGADFGTKVRNELVGLEPLSENDLEGEIQCQL